MKYRESLFNNLSIPNFDPSQDIKKIRKMTIDKIAEREYKLQETMLSKFESIRMTTKQVFSKYESLVKIISTYEELEEYIDYCIYNNIVAIDTETTGLNPITDSIIGVCLYTPGQKAVYIPCGHTNYFTQQPFDNQLTQGLIHEQLIRLEKVNCIFHNAVFDIRFIRHFFGVRLIAHWDTMIGAKVLDENESAALKFQYADKFENKKKEYDFKSLFKGVKQENIDPEIFYLYAAVDAYITYQLYMYQGQQFSLEDSQKLFSLMKNIELPIIQVIAEMEDRGVNIDVEFSKVLSERWNKMRDEALNDIYSYIDENFGEKIKSYKFFNPNHKLSDPILLTSPNQLAVLFYDILNVSTIDKEKPRSTAEEVMVKLSEKYPVCKKILTYRSVEKMLNTYIDNLPKMINEKTGKVHAHFNQYGAKTGRFSSDDPNLQNIPGRGPEKVIRQMFTASEGKAFVGGDYSQQEIRILAQFTQDPGLLHAYETGRDVYAWAASLMYHKPYEECLEFYPKGTRLVKEDNQYRLAQNNEKETDISTGEEPFKSKDGKTLRGSIKAIVLGILYGKGVPSTAQDMKVTVQEAQFLFDSFFSTFTTVKPFMEESENMARRLGYVETLWGRRRRLPDIQLPEYEFSLLNSSENFDPFFDSNRLQVDPKIVDQLLRRLNSCRSLFEKRSIIDTALQSGIKIRQNGGFIAQAVRQCVNSRIQGSAADLTKLAMIKIENDEEMKRLGFTLVLTIHDEVIGECPLENVKECGERLKKLMIEAGEGVLTVPLKVDINATIKWDGDSISA